MMRRCLIQARTVQNTGAVVTKSPGPVRRKLKSYEWVLVEYGGSSTREPGSTDDN
jgi:hypothetical protein